MADRQILIPAVVGPTASGKSALALAIAEKTGCEILSCDSMQIYRGMDIGTAKPTKEERGRVPHHLLDILPPGAPYSAADYAKDAALALADIEARGKIPLLCGGTGLYLATLRRGDGDFGPPGKTPYRDLLQKRAEKEGDDVLFAELAAVDPEAAAATHKNNRRRVVRALEIYLATGKTKSEWDRETQTHPPAYPILPIGLCYHDKNLLLSRIDRRVDEMVASGLLDECARLDAMGVFSQSGGAAQAIGYKEMLPVLRGEMPLPDAVALLKIATRQYAKRQMTWFSADESVRWLYADDENGKQKDGAALLGEALLLLSPCFQND